MKPISPVALRAAKLSRVPGVTLTEARERFGVKKSELARARKQVATLSTEELVLAMLTKNGVEPSGALVDLEGMAAYIDYVNHDGSTAADIQRMLDGHVKTGWLAIHQDTWSLLRPWP